MYTLIPITQGVIPIGLLLWQSLSPTKSQLGWLLKTALIAVYLGGIGLIGLWSILFPWWTPYLYGVVWSILTLITVRQCRKQPLWPKRNVFSLSKVVVLGIAIGCFSVVTLQAISGHFPPAVEPVSLAFPFKGSDYFVLNGGNHSLISSHMKTLDEKFRNYRGESYGVDIVKLNQSGTRSSGLLPKALDQYEIYGEPVYAPCTGRVVASEGHRPDMVPPQPDREHLLGNFVLLRCEPADVLLAHFRQDGVAVASEDFVTTGQYLGEVGNSGNTNEPHLHIHAQSPGNEATPIDGNPLPMLFNDQYLVRNFRIEEASTGSERDLDGAASSYSNSV